MTAKVSFDHQHDVLYVKRAGSKIAQSDTAANDSGLILDFDSAGGVVGVRMLFASCIELSDWNAHPNRSAIPEDLLGAVDEWFSNPAQ
jgi:uncharacterized protein YuzE